MLSNGCSSWPEILPTVPSSAPSKLKRHRCQAHNNALAGRRPHARAAARARPVGGSLQSFFDSEEILFGQQLVEASLVDPADDGGFFLAVADALG
jgi:hypothetical protein